MPPWSATSLWTKPALVAEMLDLAGACTNWSWHGGCVDLDEEGYRVPGQRAHLGVSSLPAGSLDAGQQGGPEDLDTVSSASALQCRQADMPGSADCSLSLFSYYQWDARRAMTGTESRTPHASRRRRTSRRPVPKSAAAEKKDVRSPEKSACSWRSRAVGIKPTGLRIPGTYPTACTRVPLESGLPGGDIQIQAIPGGGSSFSFSSDRRQGSSDTRRLQSPHRRMVLHLGRTRKDEDRSLLTEPLSVSREDTVPRYPPRVRNHPGYHHVAPPVPRTRSPGCPEAGPLEAPGSLGPFDSTLIHRTGRIRVDP
ncbi:unnamed protein product [Gadus morhua 'NCC']